MIHITNLSFKYKNTNYILKNINYSFLKNNIYLITGNNGAGKTTLLKLILNLLKPTHGHIHMSSNLVISYLPDFNGIYEDLTVLDNIKFRLALYNISYEKKEKLFSNLIHRYNLQSFQNTRVKELSLGMQKKVAIIATLLVDADIYIMDEPTGAIDFNSKEEIIRILNEFEIKNKTIICVTHEQKLISDLNAIVLEIKDGEMIC